MRGIYRIKMVQCKDFGLESTECPVELLYWTSPRAEDLADFIYLTYLIIILQVSQRPSFWSFFFWSPIILWQHLIFFRPIFYEMTTTNFRASSSLSFHSKEDFCSFLSDSFSRGGGSVPSWHSWIISRAFSSILMLRLTRVWKLGYSNKEVFWEHGFCHLQWSPAFVTFW